MKSNLLLAALVVLVFLAGPGGSAPHPVFAQSPESELAAAIAAGRLDGAVYDALQAGSGIDAIVVVGGAPSLQPLEFANLKSQALARAGVQARVVRDFSAFPMQLAHIANATALAAVLQDSSISVRQNKANTPILSQSLALIGQPAAQTAGHAGSGASVAVLDTEINLSAFGCTAVNTPASTCKIAAKQDFSPGGATCSGSTALHGTNVGSIASAVAPGAKILALDVFSYLDPDGSGPLPTGCYAYDSDILAALSWVVTNKATYNIVSANLSLGSGSHNPLQCSGSVYASAFTNLREAGVLPVVAAGNSAYASGSFQNGIAEPACAPGAVSVGAVYDSSLGGVSWSGCTDTTTQADKITCFSQSASYLSLLAPGAQITAGGVTMGGTSQAAPHVAGAVAVLASANPASTATQRETALTGSGPQISDSRNGVSKRRLELCAALTAVGSSCSASVKAAIISPAPGSTLPGASATFTRDNGTGVSAWGLQVGTAFGAGDLMQINSWTTTSATPTNLPTNGATVYVRLWSFLNGGWQVNDYTYQAATSSSCTPVKAAIISPAPGSSLPGASATFTRDNGCGVTAWGLQVGTAFASGNLLQIDSWTTTTATATNLPTNGSTIYVRLWSFLNGGWQVSDYTFKAAGP